MKLRKENIMKKTKLLIVLSCIPLAGLLYMLDMAKISTNVGQVEVNVYPVAGLILLALILLWQSVSKQETDH